MIVSGGQKRDLAIHIHISIPLQTPLTFRLVFVEIFFPNTEKKNSMISISKNLFIFNWRIIALRILLFSVKPQHPWYLLTDVSNFILGFPCGSAGKESTCNAGDLGSIHGLERSPREEKGYPLQYSGLEKSMDCLVHGVAKSWTLSNFHFDFSLSKFI